MVTHKFYLFVILWLGIFSSYAGATAIAKLDRTTINANETVRLSIILDESSMFSGPDMTALEKDFDILGNNKSSQSSWINGKKSANTTWIYELAPKQAGVFTIPAIDVDGQLTQPVTLQVKPANTNPVERAGVEPVFMEVTADKESVYVQEQLLLTVRINSAVSLNDLQMDELQLENAFIKEINSSQYQRDISGIPHITVEKVFAIFPQTSGTFVIPSIPAIAVVATQRRSIFDQGKSLRIRSNPLNITVNEMPTSIKSENWLPAKNISLQESWSNDPTEIKLGDSITRTITTTAVGLSAEQIPPIEIKAGSKFKSYPDQPAFEDRQSDQGVTGIRKDAIALVATEPGKITLPEITVEWWDISKNTMQTATLPEITLTVTGKAAPPPVVTPQAPTTPEIDLPDQASETTTVSTETDANAIIIWQAATALSTTLALVFMMLFLHARKHQALPEPETTQPENSASSDDFLLALKKACNSRDLAVIRSSLLGWAQLTWPRTTLHSTTDIARKFNDENFTQRMQKLDAALFSGQESLENWMGLYDQVNERHQQLNITGKNRLTPLYPAI